MNFAFVFLIERKLNKMKKTLLMFLALGATTVAAVGCTSSETTHAPETAQVTEDPQANTAVEQSGVVVQADPSAQTPDSIQTAPAAEVQPDPSVAQ